jgi:hypothetical protein
MTSYRILREVRLFSPGEWQLCFQFGTYEYDPDQESPAKTEDGYRFIWRRPNGQLQGARGQARLTPAWITTLLGKAAEAGWYPLPPTAQVSQLGTSDLEDGAEALRWAAKTQEAEWQRYGAAYPDGAREQLQRIATCLEKAASLTGAAREDLLRESVSKADLKTIASWARTALNPSFAADEHEMALRTRFASVMRRLHAGLEPLDLPWGLRTPTA